ARAFGDSRVQPRKAAQIELVDNEGIRSDALVSRLARRRRARDGFRRIGAAVFAELKHRGAQPEWPIERPRVGVSQQFGRIESSPALWIVWALDAEPIARASPEARRNAAEDAARAAGHGGPEDSAVAVLRQSDAPSALGRLSAASRPRGETTTPRPA